MRCVGRLGPFGTDACEQGIDPFGGVRRGAVAGSSASARSASGPSAPGSSVSGSSVPGLLTFGSSVSGTSALGSDSTRRTPSTSWRSVSGTNSAGGSWLPLGAASRRRSRRFGDLRGSTMGAGGSSTGAACRSASISGRASEVTTGAVEVAVGRRSGRTSTSVAYPTGAADAAPVRSRRRLVGIGAGAARDLRTGRARPPTPRAGRRRRRCRVRPRVPRPSGSASSWTRSAAVSAAGPGLTDRGGQLAGRLVEGCAARSRRPSTAVRVLRSTGRPGLVRLGGAGPGLRGPSASVPWLH